MKNKDKLASRLRQRIKFQSESTVTDSGGGSTLSWVDGLTVWAEIKPMSSRGGERLVAGQMENRLMHLVTVRYINGITPKMRILYGSRIFNIRSVTDVEERGEILEIVAEEGVE